MKRRGSSGGSALLKKNKRNAREGAGMIDRHGRFGYDGENPVFRTRRKRYA